jgi:hypothetical protein
LKSRAKENEVAQQTIEELIELAAEGDEDAAKEIKQRFDETRSQAVSAERKLQLTTDKTLKERYPRALRAWDKGYLKLDSDLSDAQVAEVLAAKENELADLGTVVDPSNTSTAAPSVEESADGARALSGGVGSGSPGGSPRDVTVEFFDALKGTTEHDQAKAFSLLVELNKTKQGDKIQQITRQLEARPITPHGM